MESVYFSSAGRRWRTWSKRTVPHPFVIALAGLVALAGIAACVTAPLVERALRADGSRRIGVLVEAIETRVERLRHLTVAIAEHSEVKTLLGTDGVIGDEMLVQQVNRYLGRVARASEASMLYVFGRDGKTRASSEPANNRALTGSAFVYRPYFQAAMRGGESRFFAVGTRNGEAGYYFARPVLDGLNTLGIAVVKIELESLQALWEEYDEPVLLIDEHGMTIAASRREWRYRDTRGLSPVTVAGLRAQRKYAHAALTPLGVEPLDDRSEEPNAELASTASRRITLDGSRWLVDSGALPDQGWKLVHLAPLSKVRNAAAEAALGVLLLGGLSIVATLYVRERHRRHDLAREAQDARRIRAMNTQLEAEVNERRQAEAERDEAQVELIQASKLAALGQMSAAVAHEVNQPLSAIRTYAASAKVLSARGRHADVEGNLDEIQRLTERLAATTAELKVFARKSDTEALPIDLEDCVRRTLQRVALDATLVTFVGPVRTGAGQIGNVTVLGDARRIEQVLGNLLTNAIDATERNTDERRVEVSIARDADEWVVRIADNGDGLDDDALEHLFDPFFTTKPVGQGVGLGLAISYGIVKDLGGRLRVRNREVGGALFSLWLACA